jgi:hypothetical protein
VAGAPLLIVVAEDDVLGRRDLAAAEDGVEEVNVALDVLGGGGMFALAKREADAVGDVHPVVDGLDAAVSVFEAEGRALGFGVGRGEQQAAGGDEGHQQVLVDRQQMFAAGEVAEARVEPVGRVGGDLLDGLIGEGVGGVAPEVAFAGIAGGE